MNGKTTADGRTTSADGPLAAAGFENGEISALRAAARRVDAEGEHAASVARAARAHGVSREDLWEYLDLRVLL